METQRDDWRTPETRALVKALLTLRTETEVERFLRDLCTLGELRDLGQRWAVAGLLADGLHYSEYLPTDRCQHGDDHADRLVAPARRGWLRLALERTRGAGPEARDRGPEVAG